MSGGFLNFKTDLTDEPSTKHRTKAIVYSCCYGSSVWHERWRGALLAKGGDSPVSVGLAQRGFVRLWKGLISGQAMSHNNWLYAPSPI